MAAVAPPPYRSPSASLPAATAVSSSTPAKKQDVAAGRRRLAEYRKKRDEEKGKKAAAVAASEDPAPNLAHSEQHRVSQQNSKPAESSVKPAPANGYVVNKTLNGNINSVSAAGSTPSEVALVVEHNPVSLPIPEAQQASTRPAHAHPDLKPVSSVGNNHARSAKVDPVFPSVSDPISSSSALGKMDRVSGLAAGQDAANANRSRPVTPPVGTSRPSLVPALPVSQEISGPLSTAQGRLEPGKNFVGLSTSPFNQISSATGGYQTAFNPVSQKPNGANLVMLDSNLVPNRSARDESVIPGLAKSEQDPLSSAMSKFSSTLVPSSEKMRSEKQTDGMNSTSAPTVPPQTNNASSLSINSVKEKGLVHPAANSSFTTIFPSSGMNPSLSLPESSALPRLSLSEAVPPKSLPLPPPPFFSSTTTSVKKLEPSQPPPLKETANSGSASTTLFPAAPSTRFSTAPSSRFAPSSNTTFRDNALLRPSAPLALQFPAPVPPHENGIAETSGDLQSPLLSRPSPRPFGKVEKADQSRPLWSSAAVADDNTMLEQHIEDLTQEKFSLQRGLDSSRSLLETLAQENSALTEDYNSQGALVNELKAETERQQGDIQAHAVFAKKMKTERDKAVQDSNAAVERSKALAAEVIDLEEKVLRARSQALKLEKEMESIDSETESLRRQILSLEKDRTNFKTLIDALQEEKSILQTQIRKAAGSGRTNGAQEPPTAVGSSVHSKADVFTSTDDFELTTLVTYGSGLPMVQHHPGLPSSLSSNPLRTMSGSVAEAFGSTLRPAEGGSGSLARLPSISGRGLNLGPSSVVPPEQAATLANINNLITELAEEKEALLKALRAESVGAAQLRNLNSELSQKLEVQTQRLELAVAQSMAHSSPPTVGSSYAVSRIGPQYVDEGDEVVERVLGWIMQLFPSGSSRRKRL